MLLLFSLGQHAALGAVRELLLPGERLFVFLDDVYDVTKIGWARSQNPAKRVVSAFPNPHQRGENTNWDAAGGPATCLRPFREDCTSFGHSASWGLDWDILITSKPSSEELWQKMRFSCRASHRMEDVSSPRGVSSSTVREGRANCMLRAVKPTMVRSFA